MISSNYMVAQTDWLKVIWSLKMIGSKYIYKI